jgi:hypothetical protein
MHDPNWFYSTLAQSSAAIVGLAGGFMVSRVLAQRSDIAKDRSFLRQEMQILRAVSDVGIQAAERVSTRVHEALPAAENTRELEAAKIETFSHPGNHGEITVYALDNNMLDGLRQLEADAIDYKRALTRLAKDEKTLSDNLRAGRDAAEFAPDWLNEPAVRRYEFRVGVIASLDQQRDWLRTEWLQRRSEYDALRRGLDVLRTRAGIGSLAGLVVVLAAFLIVGVAVPLAYLSARGGASRGVLLAAFGALAFLFLLYLANEVRRLSHALQLDREIW